MTTPTHRVIKVLPAGDITYHHGDLVDAANWANVLTLISTDYLVPLTKGEIEALNAEQKVETELVAEVVPITSKATTAKKTTKPVAKKAAPKK